MNIFGSKYAGYGKKGCFFRTGLLVVGAKRHKTTTTIKLPDLQGGPHNISAVFQKCKRLGLRVIIFCLRFEIITHAINLPKEEKLGLEVVKHFLGDFCLTSSLKLPKVLPSVEEALKIYAGASQKGRWELLLVSEKIKKTTTVPLAG